MTGDSAAEGARVVITARKQETLDEAVARLGGPEHAVAVAGNAADEDHQRAAIEAAHAAYGRLDLLVNNTGINPSYGPLAETPLEAARKILDTNVVTAGRRARARRNPRERGRAGRSEDEVRGGVV